MTVRRTLPHRNRRMVGAWCFVDHYGPDPVTHGGMFVPPHPHTGLQTVSWLLSGEVLHHDSLGYTQLIKPGQLNLMTAGRGISHAEVTPPGSTEQLHGVQLWVALPRSEHDRAPAFEHHESLPRIEVPGGDVTVIMGSVAGGESAATRYSDLVAAELSISARGEMLVPLSPSHEHAVLPLEMDLAVQGTEVPRGSLHYLPPGLVGVSLQSATPGRALLLGGVPSDETVVMWWNFLGTDHDAIAAARDDWEAAGERFGEVPGYDTRLAAPSLPTTRLKPRGRHPGR